MQPMSTKNTSFSVDSLSTAYSGYEQKFIWRTGSAEKRDVVS